MAFGRLLGPTWLRGQSKRGSSTSRRGFVRRSERGRKGRAASVGMTDLRPAATGPDSKAAQQRIFAPGNPTRRGGMDMPFVRIFFASWNFGGISQSVGRWRASSVSRGHCDSSGRPFSGHHGAFRGRFDLRPAISWGAALGSYCRGANCDERWTQAATEEEIVQTHGGNTNGIAWIATAGPDGGGGRNSLGELVIWQRRSAVHGRLKRRGALQLKIWLKTKSPKRVLCLGLRCIRRSGQRRGICILRICRWASR